MTVKSHQELLTEIEALPLPEGEVAMPCFVVLEEAMLNNLNQTIKAAGDHGAVNSITECHVIAS